MELTVSPHASATTSLVPTTASASVRPDGSAKVTQGLTSVTACIYGPREPSRVARAPIVRPNRASIHAEIAIAPWGGQDWRHRSRNDRRIVEWVNALRSTFEPVVQLHLYPRAQIDMVLYVHQQDGGVLPAMIHACTLALMDAGVAMSDCVTAMTCGLYGSTALLDLNVTEQMDLPYATVAILPRTGGVPLLQLDTRMHKDRFDTVIRTCVEAADVLQGELDAAIRGRTAQLVEAAMASRPSKPIDR